MNVRELWFLKFMWSLIRVGPDVLEPRLFLITKRNYFAKSFAHKIDIFYVFVLIANPA